MAHLRERHIEGLIAKYGGFWPVIGVLGLRQSGKSTLLRDCLRIGTYVTMDDADAQEDARLSAKTFLHKLPRPLVIDEVQRVPPLFDSIKLRVDEKRKPGSYYLTGSSHFSSRLGIRESLTGRIGILYLYPFTLAESHQQSWDPKRASPLGDLSPRFRVVDALSQFESGGLPVPLFTRKPALIKSYFQSWLETTLLRDAQRAYGKSYDADVAFSITVQMKNALLAGEYPTLKHFKQSSRKIRHYLQALEDIFLITKLCPHDAAVGSDMWTFSDTGVLASVCGTILGEGIHLSLVRAFVLKEIRALCEYSERRLRLEYFKTARGSPVDFVWKGVPVKISALPQRQVEYDLRPLRSAMIALKVKSGILMTGRDTVETCEGIRIVPWTYFS